MAEPVPESISPESLTLSLRRAGALGGGRVSSVVAESRRATIVSQITRLRLAFEGDADGAPAALILKTGLPERMTKDWSGGRQEVEFYRSVGAVMPPGVLRAVSTSNGTLRRTIGACCWKTSVSRTQS